MLAICWVVKMPGAETPIKTSTPANTFAQRSAAVLQIAMLGQPAPVGVSRYPVGCEFSARRDRPGSHRATPAAEQHFDRCGSRGHRFPKRRLADPLALPTTRGELIGRQNDDRRAVLVVVHDRNIERLISDFDLKTARSADVFEIDSLTPARYARPSHVFVDVLVSRPDWESFRCRRTA